jgi:protease-4
MAKANKLVDKIAYEDVYHDDIRKILKVDADEDYNTISILDYAENKQQQPRITSIKIKLQLFMLKAK